MRESTASCAVAAALTIGAAPTAFADQIRTTPVDTAAEAVTTAVTDSEDDDGDKTGLWGLLGLLGLAGLAGVKRRDTRYDRLVGRDDLGTTGTGIR